MHGRRGAVWLSIPLTVGMSLVAIGCGSDSTPSPQHNAGSLQGTLPGAAEKLSPSSELKQLDGSPMQGLPAGLKAFPGEVPEEPEADARPEPAVSAELKPMTGQPAAGTPSGLKAFPTEQESAIAEPAAAEDEAVPEEDAVPQEEDLDDPGALEK